MRERSYSYSPSPPRSGYRRRGRSRSRSPRVRYGGHRRDLPSSLLVRNLRHDCRPEDLRKTFGKFGPLKDIYLPRDYHSGEPRGFGFIQYFDPDDAAEAKHQMDRQILLGRELTVVFAEENRKKPAEMRARERTRSLRSSHYARSPRHSRSPSPRYYRSSRQRLSPSPHCTRSRSRSYSPTHSYSPSARHREYSRSLSPQDQRRYYSRSLDNGSRSRSPSDSYKKRRTYRERSLSA